MEGLVVGSKLDMNMRDWTLPVNYGDKRCYGTGGTGSCSDIGSDSPW